MCLEIVVLALRRVLSNRFLVEPDKVVSCLLVEELDQSRLCCEVDLCANTYIVLEVKDGTVGSALN